MMELKRLFDCLQYNLDRKPLEDMLAGKEGGQWKKYSTADVKNIVDNLSAGLLSMGVSCGDMSAEGRDKIAILCKNRPEWVMLDLAVQQIGALLVPLYPTINVNELEYVLNDAQVKYVFVNDEDLYLKVFSLKDKVPNLKDIFTFEHVPNAKHWKEVTSLSTPELINKIKPIADGIKYEDLVTIIYTSGTTGKPKGVMLSHRNILSNVIDSLPCFPPGDDMRSLSFLPLNHIFERTVLYIYLNKGVSVFFAEGFETIGQDLKDVRPVVFTTVPRLLEKVFEKIDAKGNSLKGIQLWLFTWAMNIALQFDIDRKPSLWYSIQHRIADYLVFKKWRDAIGGKIKAIVTGSAACQVKLLRLFTAANIVVMEGYGLTETSPVISVNRYNPKKRKFGTVGVVINEMQVRLGDDGEIICKGPNVMMGYYKHPEWTNEVMKEGWFHTGDIGQFVDDKFLKITDRKKEIFKINF